MRAEYPRDLDVSSDVSIDIFLIIDPTRNNQSSQSMKFQSKSATA